MFEGYGDDESRKAEVVAAWTKRYSAPDEATLAQLKVGMQGSYEELREAMEQTQTVIENRINANGLGEPTITIEGQNRLRVEIPEVEDPEEAIELIGKTAKLEFKLADGTVVLEGSNVKKAEAARDDQSTGYAVNLQFDREGADKFGEATTKAYNGEVTSTVDGVGSGAIAIVLDGQIISAPNVNEPILGGSCTITGDFDQEEAQLLAAQINGGALPIGLNEVTSSVQSATIGYNALEMSVIGGLIGLAIILLLMLFVYRGLGLCADIALLLYVVLILNIMASMGTVLTLPGIAGIIISIGMAVDANVVIFSRIREEIVLGRTVRVATETGSKRAMTTVIDSQVTTLIAAVILYEIGTSAVKVFAYTFMVGIIVSIFTAVFITQLYVKLMAGSDRFAKKSLFGIKEDNSATFHLTKTIQFMDRRKIFYCISAGILILGLGFGVIRGLNYGIDFTGGTMIQLDMGKQVKISQVDKAIDKFDLDPQIIYAGEDNDQIVIRTIHSQIVHLYQMESADYETCTQNKPQNQGQGLGVGSRYRAHLMNRGGTAIVINHKSVENGGVGLADTVCLEVFLEEAEGVGHLGLGAADDFFCSVVQHIILLLLLFRWALLATDGPNCPEW